MVSLSLSWMQQERRERNHKVIQRNNHLAASGEDVATIAKDELIMAS